jgi:hypothetical protein
LTQNGIGQLTIIISEASGNVLAYALGALQEAMVYGFGWDALSADFILKVVAFVDNNNLNVRKSALEILIHLSNSPKYGYATVASAFDSSTQKPFANLVNLLVCSSFYFQIK